MPRLSADAPDLTVSPDGAWLARLDRGRLLLYDLADPASAALDEPVMALEQPMAAGPGHLVFTAPDRLLCLLPYGGEGEDDGVFAILLEVPTLEPLSRIAVPGAQRVLGVGPAGAVVAPQAAGADVISVRGAELSLDQTFLRGDVLSAAPAPERRWLIERRGGHELWDGATRRITAHLTLATRQPPLQVGFAQGGKLIWALAGGVPVHLEFFRFSDGRRLYELDEPGRALRAEAGVGRLVVALSTEAGTSRFLDADLSEQMLRRVDPPPGPLLGFALRAAPAAPEIIALVDEDGGPRLHRLALERLSAAIEPVGPEQRPRSASPFLPREGVAAPPPGLDRRGRTPGRPRPAESRRARPFDEEAGWGGAPRPAPRPRRVLPEPLEADEVEPELMTDEARPEPPPSAASAPPRLGLGRALRRAPGGGQGPGAWHWELARWAQLLLGESGEEVAPTPPAGGPLGALTARLGLSPLGQKVLALLYALEQLAASHPQGLAPLEVAQLLGVIHDEAQVLGEVLPDGPLRRLGVLRAGPDGRLRLGRAARELLGGAPVPGLSAGTPRPGSPRLDPALYHVAQYAAPSLATLAAALPQPVLRVDGFEEADPWRALRRAMARAQVHGAAVLVDGLPGISYPRFSGDAQAPALRRLLRAPRVPLLLAGTAAALSGLGLQARALPAAAPPAESPAPALPSAALPSSTFWRAPRPPSRAAFLDGTAAVPGRLEPLMQGDTRAAIVLGPTATPDDYARAGALGARDGAVLVLESPLSAARAAVLAVLLRQVPVTVLIPPPEGGLPPELARLVE